MKKTVITIVALLFSTLSLFACQLTIVFNEADAVFYAEVNVDQEYTITWMDGTTGPTYPYTPDGNFPCATLQVEDGTCEFEECYIGLPFCGGDLVFSEDIGQICAEAAGYAPYTYHWSTGETTQCIPYNGPQDYCVHIIDAHGCAVDICQFISIDDCAVDIVPVAGSNFIMAEVSGQGPYTYLWSDGHACPIIQTVPGVEYCVTITDDTGCVATDCYGTAEDCSVSIEILPTPNFSYLLIAEGEGVAPFEFLWNTGQTGNEIYVNDSGIYCVEMIDAAGCIIESCVVIDAGICSVDIELDELEDVYILHAYAVGVEPIEYFWTNGEIGSSIEVTLPGEYCVETVDASGCHSYACIVIGEQPCAVSLELEETPDQGQVLVAYASGQAPFVYEWNTGDAGQIIPVDGQGEYCVFITDANGCVSSACYYLGEEPCSVEIIQEYGWEGIYLVASTDVGVPVEYLWSNGEVGEAILVTEPGYYCLTAIFPDGCIAEACFELEEFCAVNIEIQESFPPILVAQANGAEPFEYLWNTGETSESILAYESGIYCVTVVDAEGCLAESCVQIGQQICQVEIVATDSEPPFLSALAIGTAPFEYFWNTGETEQTIEAVEPGEYCVDVISADGCAATACYEVEDPYGDCVAFIVPNQDQGQNFLEAFVLGTGAFTYTWSTGETGPIIPVAAPGEYCVTVTNPNGNTCTACHQFQWAVETFDIRGLIHLPDNNEGVLINVELFQLQDPGEPALLIDMQTIVANAEFDSMYEFLNADQGQYLVRATEVVGIIPPKYAPTYHFYSITANDAIVINNPHLDITYHSILMTPIEQAPNGPGIISGIITDEEGRSGDLDVNVVLTDLLGNPIAFTSGETDSAFEFTNLAYGEYYLIIDAPGINVTKKRVSITLNDFEQDNIQLEIESASVTDTKQIESSEWIVFPNPTSTNFSIVGLENWNEKINLQIYSVDGKLMISKDDINPNEEIWVGNLAQGIYVVKMSSGGKQRIVKLAVKTK